MIADFLYLSFFVLMLAKRGPNYKNQNYKNGNLYTHIMI